MNIEQLRAEVQNKVEMAQKSVAEKVEVAKLEAKLNLLNNESLQLAKVRAQLVTSATDKLKELDTACSEIVSSMPIFSAKTRENRKWNPSRQYGLGNQIALVTGILSGIQYSAAEHKSQMLAYTGLNEDLVEQTLEAFGNLPYYSKNFDMVVEGSDYDLDTLHENLSLIEDLLDVQLDKSKLTDKTMSTRKEVALYRAEAAKLEAEATQELMGSGIKL